MATVELRLHFVTSAHPTDSSNPLLAIVTQLTGRCSEATICPGLQISTAAQARTANLERQLRRAEAVILQLLASPDAAAAAAAAAEALCHRDSRQESSAPEPARGSSSSGISAQHADKLLQRLQALAQQAADASRPMSHNRRYSGVSSGCSDAGSTYYSAADSVPSHDASSAGTPRRSASQMAMRVALRQIGSAAERAGIQVGAQPQAPLQQLGAQDAAQSRAALERARAEMASAIWALESCQAGTRSLLSSPSQPRPLPFA